MPAQAAHTDTSLCVCHGSRYDNSRQATGSIIQVPLGPLTVVQRALWPPQRQSGLDRLGGGFGLDRRIAEPLGLAPGAPCLPCHPPGLAPALCALLLHVVGGLRYPLSRALRLLPLAMQAALECGLGMQHGDGPAEASAHRQGRPAQSFSRQRSWCLPGRGFPWQTLAGP
jgi:hypothetical protein